MIRLLGAITGSALALATLLVFVGVPQFKAEPVEPERAIVTLPVRSEAASRTEPPEDETAPVEAAASAAPADPAGEAQVDALGADTGDAFGEAIPIDDPVFRDDPDAEALLPDSLQWYAFWSPFRSEIAANGFVEQLQRVTGLDYRVIKIKPGVYEVAFAYADDEDIPLNLSQISAATGLDMPEG